MEKKNDSFHVRTYKEIFLVRRNPQMPSRKQEWEMPRLWIRRSKLTLPGPGTGAGRREVVHPSAHWQLVLPCNYVCDPCWLTVSHCGKLNINKLFTYFIHTLLVLSQEVTSFGSQMHPSTEILAHALNKRSEGYIIQILPNNVYSSFLLF